jgi:hypothetical protein
MRYSSGFCAVAAGLLTYCNFKFQQGIPLQSVFGHNGPSKRPEASPTLRSPALLRPVKDSRKVDGLLI